MYSTLVQSLKRLYEKGKVTEDKLKEMIDKKTITKEDYDYIVSPNK